MHLNLGLSRNQWPASIISTWFFRLSQDGSPGLRSASSDRVMVPRIRTLIGNRAFPVSGAEVWNNLPPRVTSVPNLSIFCTLPRHFCFLSNTPDLLCSSLACSALCYVWRLYYISFLLLFLLFLFTLTVCLHWRTPNNAH